MKHRLSVRSGNCTDSLHVSSHFQKIDHSIQISNSISASDFLHACPALVSSRTFFIFNSKSKQLRRLLKRLWDSYCFFLGNFLSIKCSIVSINLKMFTWYIKLRRHLVFRYGQQFFTRIPEEGLHSSNGTWPPFGLSQLA